MGSDPIALPVLNFLHSSSGKDYQLCGIISQPDRPSGRGQKVSPNEISSWALEKNLKLFRPEKPSEEELSWLRNEHIDLVLVWAYGHIIKKDFLNTPPLGMLNFHGSLLPAYRGASPVETAIACGETVTGITLMQMIAKMDAGDMLDKEAVDISLSDTSSSLRLKLAEAGVPLIERNLPNILEGKCQFQPQDEAKVTYTRKINKEDGWLNFNAPAKELANRVRAFNPWPGAFFKIEGTVIKIGSCKMVEEKSDFDLFSSNSAQSPGTLVLNKDKLLIATGQGILDIISLQRPGGKMLNVRDFLRGFPLRESMKIENGPMPPLTSQEPFPWKSK